MKRNILSPQKSCPLSDRIFLGERNNMEYDLTKIITSLQNKDKISISYIQRTFSFGFTKAGKVFNELIEKGYIDESGRVNKKKIDPDYVERPKVIFLDVDGVLNCHSTKDTCCGYRGIEDKKVSYLKEIIDATGAIIVLVSSWKEWWTANPKFKSSQDEMATYLDKKLANYGLIIRDKTLNSYRRGKGILRYIEMQKENGIEIKKFVVLDDEVFDYLETKLTKHLIQTSFYQNGLEKKHVRKAIEKLC